MLGDVTMLGVVISGVVKIEESLPSCLELDDVCISSFFPGIFPFWGALPLFTPYGHHHFFYHFSPFAHFWHFFLPKMKVVCFFVCLHATRSELYARCRRNGVCYFIFSLIPFRKTPDFGVWNGSFKKRLRQHIDT